MSKLNHKLHLTTSSSSLSSSSSSSSSTKYCKLSFYTLFISLCLLIIISYLSYYYIIIYYSNPKHNNIITINNNINNNNNNNNDHDNIIYNKQIKLLLSKTSPNILQQLCLYNYYDLSYIIWSHRAYLSNITIDGSYNVMEKLLINNIKNFDIDVSCYIDDTTTSSSRSSSSSTSSGNDGKHLTINMMV